MVWVLHRKRDQQNSTDLYENFIFDKVVFQIIRKRTNYSINEWEQLTSHFEKNRWISISHLCRVSLVCSKDNFCILLHPGMCPRGESIWTLPVGSTVLRSRARPMGRTDREAQEGSGAKVPVGSISGQLLSLTEGLSSCAMVGFSTLSPGSPLPALSGLSGKSFFHYYFASSLSTLHCSRPLIKLNLWNLLLRDIFC